MKKILLIFLCTATMLCVAQDTIYTRNGEVIPAKVCEITATEIKYKKPANPDGPLYVKSKDDVALIEYKNGSKDVFQQTDVNASNSNTQQQPIALRNLTTLLVRVLML